MAPHGFIGEMCVALEHRWVPESPFLIFTAYFDESDTHGPSPNVIVAGFMASARQWELFGRKLRDLQRRYGFKTLHTKDFRAQRGEFEGWSRQKCSTFLNELAEAIRDNLTEGITALLPRELCSSSSRRKRSMTSNLVGRKRRTNEPGNGARREMLSAPPLWPPFLRGLFLRGPLLRSQSLEAAVKRYAFIVRADFFGEGDEARGLFWVVGFAWHSAPFTVGNSNCNYGEREFPHYGGRTTAIVLRHREHRCSSTPPILVSQTHRSNRCAHRGRASLFSG